MIFQTINTYDSLVLIESLRINDNKTGLQLGYKIKEYCEENNIIVSYLSISSKQQLLSTLDDINNDIKTGSNEVLSGGARYPILHFDIHGSEQGLQLSNGDFIEWDKFASKCREINDSTKNNLVVVLAVCQGYQSIVNIRINSLTPYYALIGPEAKVCEKDIERLFPDFYLELFKSNNLTDSITKLKPEYDFYHCEMSFANSYVRYIKEKCQGEGKEKRLDELVEKYKKMNPKDINYSQVREELETLVKPRKESYNKFRNSFLLSNLKENNGRFSVGFEDIINLLEKGKST